MLRVLSAAGLTFLLAPIFVVIATAFGGAPYPQFPPSDLTLKWFEKFLTSGELLGAVRLSALLSLCSTAAATVIGCMTALALTRYQFRAKSAVSAVLLSPILFPTIVLGLALLVAFYRMGLAHSFIGLVIAHTVLITPFVIRLVSASLTDFDRTIEEAARSLGAGRLKTFFRITLPIIRPGIIAGALFGFVMSFDELVITLFLAGPGLETLPIRIFSYIQYANDPTISAISTCLIVFTTLIGAPVYMRFLTVRH